MRSPSRSRRARCSRDIVHHAAQVRRVIGYVPQLVSADGALTGYEALTFMGLGEVRDKMMREYSGGMIRRLEIAESMLHRPPVLFLDEPTVGLDPAAREAVWERVADLRTGYGTTIVFTTHLMEEADHLCTRLAILRRGRVVASGTPRDLKAEIGPGTTMDDVFIHFAGAEAGGAYRETSQVRRTAQRLE